MTTLIKNIFLIDGAGRPMVKADVLVKEEKIFAVGSFPNYKADKIIFGNELYLCPGFVDINVSSDRYLSLFHSPLHEDFLKQGVTSILLGQCGFSLAPVFYGSLKQLSGWTRTDKVNINWKTVGELAAFLSSKSYFGVNVGTLVGHRILRDNILKNPNEFRKLTTNELRVLRNIIAKSVQEGAFGISFGLGDYPYNQIPYHEIRSLLDAAKEAGGMGTFHLRNEREDIFNSVSEVVRLSKENKAKLIISHFRPFVGFEEEFKKSLELIENSASHSDVYFDTNPFNASAISLDDLLPSSIRDLGRGAALALFEDKETIKKIISSLPSFAADEVIILNAPEISFINGKTLKEFADNRGLKTKEAIIELMKQTKLRGSILYNNLNQEEVDKSIFSERALVSSNSHHYGKDYKGKKPDRAFKTFTQYLAKAEEKGISIEKAVQKITGFPAGILGLNKRGIIATGNYADLVILSKDWKVSHVMVNGQMMIEDGNVLEKANLSGKFLKK